MVRCFKWKLGLLVLLAVIGLQAVGFSVGKALADQPEGKQQSSGDSVRVRAGFGQSSTTTTTRISTSTPAQPLIAPPDEPAGKRADSRNESRTTKPEPANSPAPTLRKMNAIIDRVDIQGATAKEAFEWWARTVDVKLLIDWDGMIDDAVDANAPINLDLNNVPAGVVLGLLMRRASPETDLIYQVTPWYIQIMTKRQANRTNVVRVYDVGNIVHDPTVGPSSIMTLKIWAPSTPYASAFGAAPGERSLYGRRPQPAPKSNQQMGDELCELIRSQVEPDVWADTGNGGKATLRFFRNTLVVSAPEYVHAQIGYEPRDGERPTIFLAKAQPLTKAKNPDPLIVNIEQRTETQTQGVSIDVGVKSGK
jgi:hypothetical protein